MYVRSRAQALAVALVLATMTMGATCGPKKTCETIQSWNFSSGGMVVAVWDTWHDFYKHKGYMGVVAEVMEDHAPVLTGPVIDELMAVLAGEMEPESPIVEEIYADYQERMAFYDNIAEKLEKTLNYTSEAMEIVEHASISCEGFSDKDLRKALTEMARGILEVMDILKEAKVPIPDAVMDARGMADAILEGIGDGQGF